MNDEQKTQKRNKLRYEKFRNELMEKVPFAEVYEGLGLQFTSERVDMKGFRPARSHEKFGGPDNNPSAAVNMTTGYYVDFRADKSMNVYEFMVEVGEATDWKAAQAKLARDYDVKVPRATKHSHDHQVTWSDWNDDLARKFCEMKPPVTVEGLKRSGAMMCTRDTTPCFAWAIYDENLEVIGYHFIPRLAPQFTGGINGKGKSLTKKMPGQEAGFIGTPAVRALLSDNHPDKQAEYDTEAIVDKVTRNLFWVEGVTDLVAAYSIFPNSVEFITNPNGASENVTEHQVKMLNGSPVNLVFLSDCDQPGILGANKKHKQLVEMLRVGSSSLHKHGHTPGAFTPYAPEFAPEKHGKDLRDWLLENRVNLTWNPDYDSRHPASISNHPLFLAHNAQQLEQIEQRVDEQADEEQAAEARRVGSLLDSLGLKVLDVSDTGAFVLECTATQKQWEVSATQRLDYNQFVQLCGYPFIKLVSEEEEENGGATYSFKTFRKYLALRLSEIRCQNLTRVGKGLWMIDDPDHEGDKMLAAVMNGNFFVPKDGQLLDLPGPVQGDSIIDYKDHGDWFDREMLEEYLEEAKDAEWRVSVHDELTKILGTWCWAHKNQELICAGLIYATWMQTTWPWRPIVTLNGESNSGKTYLLEFMDDLFSNNAAPIGASTAAGIQQSIKSSAMPLFCDEFDAAQEQQKIFKMFRATSRGQGIVKGTPGQGGKKYFFHHIPWLSGIQFSTDDQADLNRMIRLDLVPAPGNERTINKPIGLEANALGHRILACVMTASGVAQLYADELLRMSGPKGTGGRVRESLAVPLAAMGAVCGIGLEHTNEALNETLLSDNIQDAVREAQSDQVKALNDILRATVKAPFGSGMPTENPTVSTILSDLAYIGMWGELEGKGLMIKTDRSGWKFLAIDVQTLVGPTGLLARTPWSKQTGLGQLLRRLKEFRVEKSKVVRMNGLALRVIALDIAGLLAYAPSDS